MGPVGPLERVTGLTGLPEVVVGVLWLTLLLLALLLLQKRVPVVH